MDKLSEMMRLAEESAKAAQYAAKALTDQRVEIATATSYVAAETLKAEAEAYEAASRAAYFAAKTLAMGL